MDKTDATYELDELKMNLQRVRQELTTLLKFSEQSECEQCFLPKCKCPKTDTETTNKNQSKESNTKSASHNEAIDSKTKDLVAPPAAILPKPKWQKDQSPAPSTTEKLIDNQDKETWMEASKKLKGCDLMYTEKLFLNPKRSLGTIDSDRPADLPLNALQRSCIVNNLPANLVNSSSFLNSFPSNPFNSSNFLSSALTNLLNNSSSLFSSTNLMNSSNALNGMNFSNIPNVSSNIVNSTTESHYFKQKMTRN